MDSFIQAIACMASQPCRRRQADFRSETATRIDPLSRETRPRGQPGIGPLSPVERLCVSRHRWRWRRRRHASCRMQLLWCSCSLPLGPPPGVLPLNVKMATDASEASDMHCNSSFRTNFLQPLLMIPQNPSPSPLTGRLFAFSSPRTRCKWQQYR